MDDPVGKAERLLDGESGFQPAERKFQQGNVEGLFQVLISNPCGNNETCSPWDQIVGNPQGIAAGRPIQRIVPSVLFQKFLRCFIGQRVRQYDCD